MKLNRYCCGRSLVLLFLLLSGVFSGVLVSKSAGAAELGFKAVERRMLFTIPYETVPEVNALFLDRGDRVVLLLPAQGLKADVQKQLIDDDWVTAYGLEREGNELRWYLEKRDPLLKVKSFLALERKNSALQVVLLKEYRSWSVPVRSGKTAVLAPAKLNETKISGKMDRVRKLLESSGEGDVVPVSEVEDVQQSPPSLLMSGLRSLAALIFLALIIVALALWLKRYRRSRGGFAGSGLVKVLGVETVSGKHQVMLLELLDEVMVVGISGEQMTVLTTINEPSKVEELRLLKGGSRSGRRFGGYLKGFLERESDVATVTPSTASVNDVVETTYERPVRASTASSVKLSGKSEELPENYQEVVSQIKDRLKNSDRSQRG